MRRLAFLLLLMPAPLFADEVFLKGAGSISGRIVEQTETMVTVDIGGGVMGVPLSRVERIVKARSPLDDYDDRAAKLGPQDTAGWRDLGRWASQQGLTTQSRQAYEKVIALSPDDAEAREALGFVRLDGRWVTEEEGYRARGYVKYEGEWMTAAEAKQNATAEQARQEAEDRARDAETQKMLAENRAAKAAEEAAYEKAKADREARWGQPVYWGSWGYGVAGWPSPPVVNPAPIYTP